MVLVAGLQYHYFVERVVLELIGVEAERGLGSESTSSALFPVGQSYAEIGGGVVLPTPPFGWRRAILLDAGSSPLEESTPCTVYRLPS